jgi:hypothetical protein
MDLIASMLPRMHRKEARMEVVEEKEEILAKWINELHLNQGFSATSFGRVEAIRLPDQLAGVDGNLSTSVQSCGIVEDLCSWRGTSTRK